MNRRTFEEMVSYFNQTVADMDIDRKYKIELLGMITAILQRHDEDMKHALTIEPKKGKWIYKRDLKQFFCDQCGCPSLTDDDRYIYGMDLPNFCEDCGADMRGDEHEDD